MPSNAAPQTLPLKAETSDRGDPTTSILRSNSLSASMTNAAAPFAKGGFSPIPKSLPYGLTPEPEDSLPGQLAKPSVQAATLLTNNKGLASPNRTSWPMLMSKAREGDKKEQLEFPNGDRYSGDWNGSVPHGRGKYTWADGRVYDGEWNKGERHGVGLLVSPSGGRYKGDWKNGQMHVSTHTFKRTGTLQPFVCLQACDVKDCEDKSSWNPRETRRTGMLLL